MGFFNRDRKPQEPGSKFYVKEDFNIMEWANSMGEGVSVASLKVGDSLEVFMGKDYVKKIIITRADGSIVEMGKYKIETKFGKILQHTSREPVTSKRPDAHKVRWQKDGNTFTTIIGDNVDEYKLYKLVDKINDAGLVIEVCEKSELTTSCFDELVLAVTEVDSELATKLLDLVPSSEFYKKSF